MSQNQKPTPSFPTIHVPRLLFTFQATRFLRFLGARIGPAVVLADGRIGDPNATGTADLHLVQRGDLQRRDVPRQRPGAEIKCIGNGWNATISTEYSIFSQVCLSCQTQKMLPNIWDQHVRGPFCNRFWWPACLRTPNLLNNCSCVRDTHWLKQTCKSTEPLVDRNEAHDPNRGRTSFSRKGAEGVGTEKRVTQPS